MTVAKYGLDSFVSDLRVASAGISDDVVRVALLSPLVRRYAIQGDFVKESVICSAAQGFGLKLLHEEVDHSLAIFLVAWLPQRGTPPHDHGTWAIVSGVDGYEANVRWRPVVDAAAGQPRGIESGERVVVGPGDCISFLPADIHSVSNPGESVSVSLHVYGRHLNYVQRSQFDPLSGKVEPFKVHLLS